MLCFYYIYIHIYIIIIIIRTLVLLHQNVIEAVNIGFTLFNLAYCFIPSLFQGKTWYLPENLAAALTPEGSGNPPNDQYLVGQKL